MINVLELKPQINKEKIYHRNHLAENNESCKCAEDAFDELSQIIRDNMKITGIYNIVDNNFSLHFDEIDGYEMWKKYVLCFISSKDQINSIVNDLMSSGEYLKGYLLNEMATDAIFNASDEMNKMIKNEVLKLGYKLTEMYAPGDGILDLKYQETLMYALKKETSIDAYLTEEYMIVPEKSLLYLFGAENIDEETNVQSCSSYSPNSCNLNEQFMEDDENSVENCRKCGNLDCEYRKYNS